MVSHSVQAKSLDAWLVKVRRWAVTIVLSFLYPMSVMWLLILFMPNRR
jgi:hypothetical protein